MLEFPAQGANWTFKQFYVDVRRVAGGLLSLGLGRGDRLAIMLPNRPEYVLGWFASLYVGAIDVAVNHGLVRNMLAHQLNVAGVKAILCNEASGTATSAGPHRNRFEKLLSGPEAEPAFARPEDPISIRYTSGTTGPAKAVALSSSQMTVFTGVGNWLLELGPGHRLYTCFPLHHSLASIIGVVGSLQAGTTCIVDERFSASRYWERIRTSGATRAQILNPMVAMVLSQPPSSQDRDHECSLVWTAPLNTEFEARFGTTLVTHYSMTEGNIIAYLPPGAEPRPGSSGKISPMFEVRIADEFDRQLPAGEAGHLLWRPREPFTSRVCYFGDADATVSAWRNLWFHSGDEARIDEDGHLYLIGRIGDQIRRKGVNIPAQHIEDAALEHPASDLGESEIKLALVIPPESRPEAAALADFLAERLPSEMVPRFLEFRDSLPRTDTLKLSKSRLRTEGEHGLTASTIDLRTEGSSAERGAKPPR